MSDKRDNQKNQSAGHGHDSHGFPTMPATEHHAGETTNTKVILLIGVGLLAAVAIIMLLMVLLVSSLTERNAKRDVTLSPLVVVPAPSTSPRLQVDERLEIAELRQREKQALTSYDWVDKEKGVARIPVARAMQLLLEKGDMVRPGPVAPGAEDPY